MIAGIDPDVAFEFGGFIFKMWLVLVVFGLPAQALLVLAFRAIQKRRRIIAAIGAALVAVIAALLTDVIFYPYDGSVSHSVILWAWLAAFSIPAHLLIFFAIFRWRRMLPRLVSFAASVTLMTLGIVAFFGTTIGYGLRHSLGGWP